MRLSIRPLGNWVSVSRFVPCGGTKNAVGFTDCSSHLFAAALARVLVAVAGILEFRPALEEFQNELVGPPTHVVFVSRMIVGLGTRF